MNLHVNHNLQQSNDRLKTTATFQGEIRKVELENKDGILSLKNVTIGKDTVSIETLWVICPSLSISWDEDFYDHKQIKMEVAEL